MTQTGSRTLEFNTFTFRVHSHGLILEDGPRATTLDWGRVRQLRDFLNDYVPSTTPPDDPRVTELIRCAKWSLEHTPGGIHGSANLWEAIRAFDPHDPDAELVDKMAQAMIQSANDIGIAPAIWGVDIEPLVRSAITAYRHHSK